MRGLTGRTYIVTGAASGIGRASALRLLDEGARVVGADIVEAAPPDSADHDANWMFTPVDVSDESSVAAMVDVAVEFGGRLHGLVNAAGVASGGPVHMLATKEWQRVLDVNLTGTYLTAKHVIAHLLSQPADDGVRGSIVTIASIEGLEGTAGGSAYSASKGGVVLLTKNMAIDYGGRGIRVNAICPGFIETPMTEGIFKAAGMESPLAEIVNEHKLRRMGQPDEIAAVSGLLALRRRLLCHRPRHARRRRLHRRSGPRRDRHARTLGPRNLMAHGTAEVGAPAK